MKTYSVNIGGKTILVVQDDDGKFIKPECVRELEPMGTALKPAHEPIVLARKPLSEKTVAENVLKWGTGGINIDGCRIDGEKRSPEFRNPQSKGQWGNVEQQKNWDNTQGRFPANLIHDGSDEVLAEFEKAGNKTGGHWSYKQAKNGGLLQLGLKDLEDRGTDREDGSPARFFYCAKASRAERDAGLEGIEAERIEGRDVGQDERNVPYKNRPAPQRNQHPTVKPLALMRYLIKLITPPNGIILDPFMGSGSTLITATQLGFRAIGIEFDENYCEIALARYDYWKTKEEGNEKEKNDKARRDKGRGRTNSL